MIKDLPEGQTQYEGTGGPSELSAGFGGVSPAPTFPAVLDACCGGRAMWFDRNDRRAVYVDIREGVFPISRQTPRSPVVVKPDWIGSFTALPFASNTFHHVVFDPPHMTTLGVNSNMAKTYGRLQGDWRDLLRQGFSECFRVLKPSGTLIFKWCEYDVPISDVLALTAEKPLYGHRSGKQQKTHWIAFMKTPNAQSQPASHSEARLD